MGRLYVLSVTGYGDKGRKLIQHVVNHIAHRNCDRPERQFGVCIRAKRQSAQHILSAEAGPAQLGSEFGFGKSVVTRRCLARTRARRMVLAMS
jgi:hypothetical protein